MLFDLRVGVGMQRLALDRRWNGLRDGCVTGDGGSGSRWIAWVGRVGLRFAWRGMGVRRRMVWKSFRLLRCVFWHTRRRCSFLDVLLSRGGRFDRMAGLGRYGGLGRRCCFHSSSLDPSIRIFAPFLDFQPRDFTLHLLDIGRDGLLGFGHGWGRFGRAGKATVKICPIDRARSKAYARTILSRARLVLLCAARVVLPRPGGCRRLFIRTTIDSTKAPLPLQTWCCTTFDPSRKRGDARASVLWSTLSSSRQRASHPPFGPTTLPRPHDGPTTALEEDQQHPAPRPRHLSARRWSQRARRARTGPDRPEASKSKQASEVLSTGSRWLNKPRPRSSWRPRCVAEPVQRVLRPWRAGTRQGRPRGSWPRPITTSPHDPVS